MCAVTAMEGIFVGHGIGSDGIAAVNICVPLLMVFTGIGLMCGIGSSVISSIALSKGKIKVARLNVTQSLLFVTTVTLILTVIMMVFPDKTAYLLGSSEHLLEPVKEYLIWFLPSLVFQMWISVGLFIIRLDCSPKLAMWCSVIAALLSTFLGWLFIFPFGWGIKGAALAATAGIAIGGSIAMAYLLFFARSLKLYSIKIGFRGLHLFFKNIAGQCRIGSSALLGEATMAVLMFVGNHVFMRYLGDDGVGAFGICCYYTPFVFMVGNAIAQSAQPIISFNFGSGDGKRVAETEKIALYTALGCGLLVTAVFTLFPHVLVGFFIDTSNPAARLAISGFPYFAAGFSFFIINLTAVGYFQSIESIRPATVFALCRGVILLIPAFIIMPRWFGTNGIWLAMPVSEFLTTAAVFGFYLLHKKTNGSRNKMQPLHSV